MPRGASASRLPNKCNFLMGEKRLLWRHVRGNAFLEGCHLRARTS